MDHTPVKKSLSKLTDNDHRDSIVEKQLVKEPRVNLDANGISFTPTSGIMPKNGVWQSVNEADPKSPIDGPPDFETVPLNASIAPSNQADYELYTLASQPVITQDSHLLVPVVPFSDSGYGTASHCSRKVTQLNALDNAIHQEQENHSNPINPETDDTATEYSDTMSLSDSRIDGYVSGLAEDLFRRLDPNVASDQITERLSTALPRLLKAFALKFGFEAPSQMHRDVMFFIHKHRM